MILSKLKLYLIAIVGAVISATVVIVNLLVKKNSQLKRRVQNAEAKVHHARVVAQEDTRLIQDEQSREAQIVKDLEDSRTEYDPNSLFVRDKDNR